MLLGSKEVTILPAASSSQTRYLEDGDGYVYLSHGDVYQIKVRNGSPENCGVSIEIDGKKVGAWRVNAYYSGTIERSVDDEGRFTFYELDSDEATKSDLTSVAKNELGLVKVTFIPEKAVAEHPGMPVIDMYPGSSVGGMKGEGSYGSIENQNRGMPTRGAESYSGSRGGAGGQSVASGSRGRSAGGTGLSGRSSQQFDRVEQMDLDYDRVTVINLRLVAKPNDEPRPLRAVSSIMSNLVPPAVD